MNAPQVLLYAADTVVLSVLIPALAWLATRAFPTRANMRHLVWLAATLILLTLPVVTALVPPQIVLRRAAEAVSVAAPLTGLSATVTTAADAAPAAAPPGVGDAAIVLGAVWVAGGLAVALRGLIASLGLIALRRRSTPHDAAALDLPAALHAGPWELRLAKAGGPVTWGVFRPTVLVPEDALQWPRARLEAVLQHELAHVRRRDSLTQSLSMLVCALYWPNPMVWIAARALRREAEIAADDAVIASGVKPSDYAGELLRMAAEFRQRRPAFGGVSMASPSALTARVQSILSPASQRKGVTVMDRVKIACLALAATSTLALARPGLAEPAPPPAAKEPMAPTVFADDTDLPAEPALAPPAAPTAPPAPPSAPAPPAPPSAPYEARIQGAEARAAAAQGRAEAQQAREEAERVRAEARAEAERRREEARAEAERGRQEAERARAEARAEAERSRQEALAQAHARAEAHRALAEVGPQVRDALRNAHIDETVAKALDEARPKIEAASAQALAEAEPKIRKAIADAHIDERVAKAIAEAHIGERVAKALADAQPRIEAALARAHRAQDTADGKREPE